MATTSMNLPAAAAQAPTENMVPHTSAVVDWVHQQSQHDEPRNASTMNRRAQMVTPPPYSVRTAGMGREQSLPRRKVYDAVTLLKLRETQSAVPVMLRVKPEAIAENIFQYMAANSTRRLPTRSRGLSEISNLSRGSVSHNNDNNNNNASYSQAGSTSFGHAIRQPIAPPQSSMLQQHDGFVRFLKQHASPPHHRVTAGGRIVPAGPSSPPPMLDFGSLNTIVGDRTLATKLSQNGGRLTSSTHQLQSMQSQPTVPVTSGAYPQRPGYDTVAHSFFANTVPTALPCNNFPSGHQLVASSAPQTAAAMVPIAMLADGSTILSYNGINYRAYWNGVTMMLEPLQMLPIAIDQQLYTTGEMPVRSYESLVSVPRPVQTTKPSLPLASGSQIFKERPTSHAAGNSEENLKTQLTNLDKYLALYHYEITPAERAAYVTQRRYLVEEIDQIRVSREQPKRGIPIIEPTTGANIVPAAHQGPDSQAKPRKSSAMHKAVQELESAKEALKNKGLSPAAPAFVPKHQQPGPLASSRPPVTQQPKKHSLGLEVQSSRLRFHTPFSLQDVTNAAISRKDKVLPAYAPDGKDVSPRHASSSSILDPSDPAMRVIDYEDIEYAERYLYNWTQATKTYCTTVAEFQEAVRRVREQARIYGCEGGQSKDPAYDAEQDIWWAICDRDPIPLPSKVPDHVANPRPWNWNDSAFNYRREGSPYPGPECDKARNSPRLAGWDPVITEAMKDKTDVSRSYFALKGQLPSVPFRDFAHDRQGNKVNIESGTAANSPDIAIFQRGDEKSSPAPKASNATQTASSPDASVLKDVSTSDLNGRHIGPLRTNHYKFSKKQNLSDSDAIKSHPQSSMRASHVRPVQSVVKVDPEVNDITSASKSRTSGVKADPRYSQPKSRPYQSYVEEYPETPVARHMRADSKGSPTPHSCIVNKPKGAHEALDVDASEGQPFTLNRMVEKEHVPYSRPGWGDEPTDVNDPWYGPPTDPITLEYLARLKTWCPGDPDVLETMAAEQKEHCGEDATFAFQEELSASMTKVDSPRRNVPYGTRELSAETRSPWGPEQDSSISDSPLHPCPIGRPVPTTPTHSFEARKTAKVNIPNATYKGVHVTGEIPIETLHANNVDHSGLQARAINTIKTESRPKTDSHHFLRKMLKSPTFTSAQALRFPLRVSSKLVNTSKAESGSTTKTENMGFSGGSKLGLIDKELLSKPVPLESASAFISAPNASFNKAQSSLASSSYQAQGYLRRFGGLGKAYAASLYGDQIDPGPISPVRVNLPPHTSYDEKPPKSVEADYQAGQVPCVHNVSTNHHLPVAFGFDGGADSPPPKKGLANSSNDPNFDYKGVTVADYEIQRPDPDSAWHQGEVEDFFQTLAKEEETEILSHRRVHTQSAA